LGKRFFYFKVWRVSSELKIGSNQNGLDELIFHYSG